MALEVALTFVMSLAFSVGTVKEAIMGAETLTVQTTVTPAATN